MIFEDLIDKQTQNLIEEDILSRDFPWFFCPYTIDLTNATDLEKTFVYEQGLNPNQFVHLVVSESKVNSQKIELIRPVLQNLAEKMQKNIYVEKAKFNFLPQAISSDYHYPHVDVKSDNTDMMSMIYYVNNCDGDTYFFDDVGPKTKPYTNVVDKVTPKKGKAVIFESKQFHSGSSPIVSEKRIVLNVVFKTI